MAEYYASRGDTGRALQILADLHTIGLHKAKGATLVEQLTGAAICGLSYGGVLSVLDHGVVNTEALKAALDRLTWQIPWFVVPRYSEIERLYGRDCIQRMFTDDGKGNGRLIPGALYRSRRSQPSPYLRPLSYVDAVRICLTHPDRRSTVRAYESCFTRAGELAHRTPWGLHVQNTSYENELKTPCFGNYFLYDGIAATAQCIRIGWRTRVSGEATVAILALFAYKAKEGRFPESLQQLVDKELILSVPMDPYSDAPLVYKAAGNRFTLYSVGEDFTDNGGRPCEWDDKDGDHVFWPVPASSK